MKFKKSWIFWICYYGVAITANVLAAILLRDKWNFNGWSAFPIVYLLVAYGWIWYFRSKLYEDRCEEYYLFFKRFYRKDFNEVKYHEDVDRQQKEQKRKAADNKAFTIIVLLCAPILSIFILFFSTAAKALSFLVAGVPFLLGILIWLISQNDASNLNKQREEELKEQREREELGKWR